MPKPPSLQDVATRALVSPATVSRYINGSLTLPADTAGRIDAAIAALGYRPNPHARSLSRGKSDMVGLVIPNIENPFFAQLAAAVETAAAEAGLAVMLCSTFNRLERELDYLARLSHNFVDGLLFATNHPDNGILADKVNSAGNIILIDEDIDDTHAPKIFSDNYQGGLLAGRHLAEMGHTELAFVGGSGQIMSTRERARGLADGASAVNPDARVKAHYFGAYTIPHGQAAMTALLAEHPEVTAAFVSSDEIMFGALSVMRERGVVMGRDLSIVTFDDAGPLAFFDPPVTAIRQPIADIGRQAVQMLIDRLNGEPANPVCALPVELIVRNSVRRIT